MIDLTIYFVGNTVEEALAGLPFDSAESADSYANDAGGNVYAATAHVDDTTIESVNDSPTGFAWVELGEGYSGEYDPEDPDDTELLRLDWNEEGVEVESLCTSMPVSTNSRDRERALEMVRAFVDDHPARSPRSVVDLFSHMEPSWLTSGIPENVRQLFNIAPTS